LFRRLKINQNSVKKVVQLTIKNKIGYKSCVLLLLISSCSFLLVFQSNNYSILAMIIRGGDLLNVIEPASTDASPTKWLIINNFIRPTAMMCFFYYAISPHHNRFIYYLLMLLAVVTCFPTGMPRFAAAAMYIPFMLLIFKYTRKKNVFSLMFILGLLVVFPFLDIFRVFSEDANVEIGLNFDMFLEGHFDSYQNFALIVSHNIITYGRQLLGVIFFWMPRSIWDNKPIGSGAFAAEKLNFTFDNVSANYFAEGYVNFGLIGIFLFLIVLAYATARLDALYWKYAAGSRYNYFSVLYTISLGFLFFILRGDLLSSTAYAFGFVFSAMLVYKVLKLKITY
jgi:oligosaccharide repeat unit polymerase